MKNLEKKSLKKFLIAFVVLGLILFLNSTQSYAVEKVYFYHIDIAGTPISMTDESGNVVWEADYMPFGEEDSVTYSTDNNRRLIGKEKDEETGLYYFGARYMDAGIGRFIKTDPIGIREKDLLNPQKINRYIYSLNNPYKYVDADGKEVTYIGAEIVWKDKVLRIYTENQYKYGSNVTEVSESMDLSLNPKKLAFQAGFLIGAMHNLYNGIMTNDQELIDVAVDEGDAILNVKRDYKFSNTDTGGGAGTGGTWFMDWYNPKSSGDIDRLLRDPRTKQLQKAMSSFERSQTTNERDKK